MRNESIRRGASKQVFKAIALFTLAYYLAEYGHLVTSCSMDRWKNKVAVVTGASAGIGASIALELVKQGIHVVALARRLDRLEDLKKDCKGPGELHPLKADVSKDEDIEEVFQFVRSKFGAVHILVNNAGVIRPGHVSDQDPKLMREVLNTNVMGLTLCTQQALKLMKEKGIDDGHIVHINSVTGHKVVGGGDQQITGMYAASKFAVTALTETLRQELVISKSKTKVTSISPGFVATEIFESGMKGVGNPNAKEFADALSAIPALQPQDLADAVVYVLSTPPTVQVHELTIKPIGEYF